MPYSSGRPRVHASTPTEEIRAAIQEYEAKASSFDAEDERCLLETAADLREELNLREIALCEDCADAIGGACAGPEVPWRRAENGEACGAADHEETTQ